MEVDECDDFADCSNTGGSYTCACQNGYVSNGTPQGHTCDGKIYVFLPNS